MKGRAGGNLGPFPSMSKSALLDACGLRGRQVIMHEEDGRHFVETRQDATHIIEAAKVLASEPPRKEDGWRFLGFLPEPVFNQACVEGWIHDKVRVRQWLNDRDNRAFNGGRDYVS